MSRLLQQVDALTASLSDTTRDAAVTILASNMQAMNLALGDAAEVRGLAVDLAAVLAGDVTGDAYLRAAAELTCMQERRVDTQVRTTRLDVRGVGGTAVCGLQVMTEIRSPNGSSHFKCSCGCVSVTSRPVVPTACGPCVALGDMVGVLRLVNVSCCGKKRASAAEMLVTRVPGGRHGSLWRSALPRCRHMLKCTSAATADTHEDAGMLCSCLAQGSQQ